MTTELIRQLAVREPDGPVLSVHLRTDPCDPANNARTSGWLVALRNGLREASRAVEERGSHDDRLALRELVEQVEADVSRREPPTPWSSDVAEIDANLLWEEPAAVAGAPRGGACGSPGTGRARGGRERDRGLAFRRRGDDGLAGGRR